MSLFSFSVFFLWILASFFFHAFFLFFFFFFSCNLLILHLLIKLLARLMDMPVRLFCDTCM